MKTSLQLGLVLLFVSYVAKAVPQSADKKQAILRRDVDPRPLPKVPLTALSPKMRSYIKTLLAEEMADVGSGEMAKTVIYRIPVAPAGHRLYLIDQNGKNLCAPDGAPNCPETVVDETAQELETVTEGGSAGVMVVRRPHLQMPDVAVIVQEGHFATDVTAYRYDGKRWKTYLCKHIEPIGNDPTPDIVADAPCTD